MKMCDDKKIEFQANRWSSNKERSFKNAWYAIGRIDLLIVSISGAGIYSCFEMIKFFETKIPKHDVDYSLLKYSSSLFVASIIINFISQFLSEKTNNVNAYYSNKKLLEIIEDSETNCEEYGKLDCKMGIYDTVIEWSNYISATTMLVGISILTKFLFDNI